MPAGDVGKGGAEMSSKDKKSVPEGIRRELHAMQISQWMTKPVMTVKPLDSLRAARELMAERRINQLPVVRNNKLVGILTDRDLRDAYPTSMQIYRGKGIDEFADSHTVQEVMTFNVTSVTPDSSLEETVTLLRRHRIGALPVIEGGELVGIITRSDILDFLLGDRS